MKVIIDTNIVVSAAIADNNPEAGILFLIANDVINFMLNSNNINEVLDVIELSFRLIDTFYKNTDIGFYSRSKIKPDDAINRLNIRFREHGVGYQYESGEIIRVDSQIIHAEAVKPVLVLLSDTRF
ncbi:MAG: hypothetical protein V7K34_30065 [Nostoc sp.]